MKVLKFGRKKVLTKTIPSVTRKLESRVKHLKRGKSQYRRRQKKRKHEEKSNDSEDDEVDGLSDVETKKPRKKRKHVKNSKDREDEEFDGLSPTRLSPTNQEDVEHKINSLDNDLEATFHKLHKQIAEKQKLQEQQKKNSKRK